MGDTDSLVTRAQHGDVEAFGELVKAFQDAVFGAAYATVGTFQDAQDIAQETFILAYQALPQLRDPAKFPGWLRRITLTACHRFLRSRKPMAQDLSTALDGLGGSPGADTVIESREASEQIIAEINTLSEKNRLVTVLHYVDGYSYKEIGDFLGVPISTVKSRLYESRKKLRGRLMHMARAMLHKGKPGDAFAQQLREKLNGRIVDLSDGRIQVYYDFVDERQLQDWRIWHPYKAAPTVKKNGLVFGRVEPEETEQQWDRDIRLNLVFDPDPRAELEIDFDVSMGTNEPWSCAAWVLTRRDGSGPGIRFLYGVITDWNQAWRETRETDHVFREGHLRADLLRRYVGDEGSPEEMSWIAPTQDVPLAETYHMGVTRQNGRLCWTVNDRAVGQTTLAKDELSLTERLMLCNYGKGTGAVFKNVVIRAQILDVDPSWPARDT